MTKNLIIKMPNHTWAVSYPDLLRFLQTRLDPLEELPESDEEVHKLVAEQVSWAEIRHIMSAYDDEQDDDEAFVPYNFSTRIEEEVKEEEDEDEDACTECGDPNDDGEGYDGLCGNCADINQQQEEEDNA